MDFLEIDYSADIVINLSQNIALCITLEDLILMPLRIINQDDNAFLASKVSLREARTWLTKAHSGCILDEHALLIFISRVSVKTLIINKEMDPKKLRLSIDLFRKLKIQYPHYSQFAELGDYNVLCSNCNANIQFKDKQSLDRHLKGKQHQLLATIKGTFTDTLSQFVPSLKAIREDTFAI